MSSDSHAKENDCPGPSKAEAMIHRVLQTGLKPGPSPDRVDDLVRRWSPDERSPAYDDQSCPTRSFVQATALLVQRGGEGSSEVARRLEGGPPDRLARPNLPTATGHYRGIAFGRPRTLLSPKVIDNTHSTTMRDADCELARMHARHRALHNRMPALLLAAWLAWLGKVDSDLQTLLCPSGLRSTAWVITGSQDTASRIFVSILHR